MSSAGPVRKVVVVTRASEGRSVSKALAADPKVVVATKASAATRGTKVAVIKDTKVIRVTEAIRDIVVTRVSAAIRGIVVTRVSADWKARRTY